MERTPLDFIVLALPRSGTSWVANWLTTERSLCLHDPFALGLPSSWPKDERARGISCTAAYLMRGWVDKFDCPVAVIERDPAACDESLRELGLPDSAFCQAALREVHAQRFAFEGLWDEGGARELWEYLLPQIPFDALRWRLLKDMQVQPYWPRFQPDHETAVHVTRAVMAIRGG
jgi:hypothetical protein